MHYEGLDLGRSKELDYFYINGEYGGDQDWFLDPMMKLGGCGAKTAYDCSIYFSLYKGKDLYPFDKSALNKKDYVRFGSIMKPYLRPRMTGINRLDIYTDGFGKYLEDRGEHGIVMREFPGTETADAAKKTLEEQIDKGFPAPVLTLRHKLKKFSDFVWHWYIINGYKKVESEGTERFLVKVVSYGEYIWFDFDELWDTGYEDKGGLILFDLDE